MATHEEVKAAVGCLAAYKVPRWHRSPSQNTLADMSITVRILDALPGPFGGQVKIQPICPSCGDPTGNEAWVRPDKISGIMRDSTERWGGKCKRG